MFSCVQTTTVEAEAASAAAGTVTNTAMSNVFVSDRKPARAGGSGGGGSGSTLRDAVLIALAVLSPRVCQQ